MQETEIKVRFNDGGMMDHLQEMLDMLDDIQDRALDIDMPDMPTQGRPPSRPSSTTDGDGRGGRGFDRARSFASGVGGATASGVLSQVSNEVINLGKALGGFSGAALAGVGIIGSLKAQSLQMRSQQIGEIINLEGLEAQLMGLTDESGKELGSNLTKQLTKFGFSSAEARQLGVGTAQAFGREISGSQLQKNIEELALLQRTGISSQGVASLAGSIQQATGKGVEASFKTAFDLTDLAEGLDLRGAGVDRFLSSFSGIAESFTKTGITFKPREIAKFARGIADATGQTGQRPMQIVQSLMGVAGGARAGFAGNFQQLANIALQAEAFRGAKSPMEALQRLEELQQDPDEARKAILRALGTGEAGQIALASIEGIGTRDARKLVARDKEGKIKSLKKGFKRGVARITEEDLTTTMDISAKQAETDRQIIEEGRKSPELLKEVIRVQGELQKTMLKFTDNESKVTGLVELMQKALEKIEQYTP